MKKIEDKIIEKVEGSNLIQTEFNLQEREDNNSISIAQAESWIFGNDITFKKRYKSKIIAIFLSFELSLTGFQ